MSVLLPGNLLIQLVHRPLCCHSLTACFINRLDLYCYRMEGEGDFVDENGVVWTGTFNGTKAAGLKHKLKM